MFTASKCRRAAFALAVLFACCAPALGDEFQYLPDNVRVIASINVTAGAKTKTFREFIKLSMVTGVGAKEAEEQARQEANLQPPTREAGSSSTTVLTVG